MSDASLLQSAIRNPQSAISSPSPVTNPSEEGEAVEGYRPICGLAVAGAVVGALSVAAFLHPLFWSLALVGVLLNGAALWRIAFSGQVLTGKGAALVGLTCSLLFGSMAVTNSLLKPVRISGEARRQAEQWFAELARGEAPQAHQRTYVPWRRLGDERPVEWLYGKSPVLTAALAEYVGREPVRTLLALGERAKVSFVRDERMQIGVDDHRVEEVFEVAVEHNGRRTPRLLKIEMRCVPNLVTKEWGWDVKTAEWLESPPEDWN